MLKKIGLALVVVFSLLGAISAYNVGRQAVTDYQNFRKMVIWVAQKQLQEEQARQRQAAAKPIAPPQAPAPAPTAEATAGTK